MRLVLAALLGLAGAMVAMRQMASPGDLLTATGGATFEGGFTFQATVDPASHTTVTAVNTDVAMPSGLTLVSTDLIVAVPPAALEAGMAVQGCVYKDANTLTLRTTNPTAGTINPASATWTFIVLRK